MSTTELELAGRRVRLTNLERVLWPATGFTKGDMVSYYLRAAPWILPHLAGRPLTLWRFPEGVDGPSWWQNECRGSPPWLATAVVRGQRFCLVDDSPSLAWVANLGTVELHPFLARADAPETPTALAFDLDPGPPAGLLEAVEVALRVREALAQHGLASYPKTSGGTGIHVFAPLEGPSRFAETKAFARSLARELAAERQELVTDRSRRAVRVGRVLVDWLQNDATRSTAAPYSLRATAVPSVSTPLAWDELAAALAAGRPELLRFGPAAVLDRLMRLGDLFAPVLAGGQALPPATTDGTAGRRY